MRLRIFKQLNLFIGTFNDLTNPRRGTKSERHASSQKIESSALKYNT